MTHKPAYQVEPTDLRALIWERGHIEPWELLRIVAWKSAKGLAPLSLNKERSIRDRTAFACQSLQPLKDLDVLAADDVDWEDWEKRVRTAVGAQKENTGLLGLSGVGYPVATAILCILNPLAFPVLDRWALRGLYPDTGPSVSQFAKAAKYREYTVDLVLSADSHPTATSIHKVDQAAMTKGMS